MEIWKDIEGYEGLYQVSNLGRVKSLERYKPNKQKVPEKIKALSNNGNGYFFVSLYKNNKPKLPYIHRLVAAAFIDNPENKETVNHIDANKANNCVDNLEWATPKEQAAHTTKLGNRRTGGRRLRVIYKDNTELEFKTVVSLAAHLNCNRDTIYRFMTGKRSSVMESLGVSTVVPVIN